MDLVATGLDRALRRANVPIIGVIVGNAADRATWKIQYVLSASAADRSTGDGILATYDVATDTTLQDENAQTDLDQRAIKAAVLTALWGRLGRQPTALEISAERARFVQIYKSLA